MSVGFDPERILRTLNDHGVDFVLVGGLAARLLGSPSVTHDVDVCAEWGEENRQRIAEALVSLNATLRGAPDDVPFQLDATTLGIGRNFTFSTDAGPLDFVTEPSGGLRYDDLARSASVLQIDLMLSVKLIHIDDLIHLKQSAGRRKDLIEVEVLEAVRDARQERGLDE